MLLVALFDSSAFLSGHPTPWTLLRPLRLSVSFLEGRARQELGASRGLGDFQPPQLTSTEL